ncbi:Uncharacterised protein [Acinetobacter phage MD-2021a]|nr:Uncharacterised protein [Acinetobacter phage MD-2021a]CAH1088832.1 Uncharacterised protein [Acinetobacter phage MD-2021a]
MASTKIQNLPLKAPIGAMKIPTGGFGDYSITVSSIGDFIIDAFNLATKEYVDTLIVEKEDRINLTGGYLTPTSQNSSVPDTTNDVIDEVAQALLDKIEYVKDVFGNRPLHNELEGRSEVNSHPSTSISHGSGTVSSKFSSLDSNLNNINNNLIPNINNNILLKQDKIVNDNNFSDESSFSPVPSTNSSFLNASLQALVNRDEFLSVQFNKGITPTFDQAFVDKIGGYPIGAELVLSDGLTKVVNTVANNTNNPNSNLLGWKLSSAINVVSSIAELLLINNPKNGDIKFVQSYHEGLNKGGGIFVYDSLRADENDGFLCINGWVLQHDNVFTPYHSGCKCDGVTDDTLNFDKLMYALERNNLKGHVIINDPMFFNSQCPRIGKLIDPVQFNEKNAIRLVSNVKLEINSTLTFGSFYSGSSGQPKCNILSAMYRADVDDWYGKNRHENIEVFGTGTLDFTATESESAVQDGYRWIIKASVKNMKIHGLKFQGGDFANAVQTSKTSENIEIYDNKFINLMSDASLFHDHSTVYCIGKDIKVHDNTFVFTNVKGRLNACACELHGSEQWFYNNRITGYPNMVFSAILRTDQSLDANEVVYDQKVYDNTARISRSALGYWSILNQTAKLNDLDFYDNDVTFIEAPTLAEYTAAGVQGLAYPSDLSASIFTVWHEGDSVSGVTYAAEVLDHIMIRDNVFSATDAILNNQIVSMIRFVGSYVRENLKIRNNEIRVNTLLNRDVSTSTANDYFKGWDISSNSYDFSKFKNERHGMLMYLEYMQDCVFDFDFKTKFPTVDKTYNLLNFVFVDDSKVSGNTIKINPNGSYKKLDSWLGGDFNSYSNANMSDAGNYVESTAFVYILEKRETGKIIGSMGVQSGSIPPSVKFGRILNYTEVMLSSVMYPSFYTTDYSGVNKLIAPTNSTQAFAATDTSDRFAYMVFST